jgi:hypothetical protein
LHGEVGDEKREKEWYHHHPEELDEVHEGGEDDKAFGMA